MKRLYLFLILFITQCLFLTAPAFAIDLKAHGYFRTRGEAFQELDLQKSNSSLAHDNHRFGLVAFNQMRLRVEPNLKVNDNISVFAQLDIFDNVVFGTETTKQLQINDPMVGTVTLPAGSGSITMVGGEAGENKALNVRRVYMDILTPVGKLRVGRQPSHWGLGIFQNDGNERQGDFGDTADRVLFLSQFDVSENATLAAGLLWDITFEAQYDPRINGLAGAISSNGKDTQQYAMVLLYQRPEASFGFFGGVRRRSGGTGTTTTALNPFGNSVAAGIDGKTLVYFLDAYGSYTYNEYTFKAEYVFIGGKMSTGVAIDAIPFSIYYCDPADPACVTYRATTTDGIIQLPSKQDVRVNMAAFEASGNYKWGGEWGLKSGFAQGDASPLSQRITQYGFRPDYQIALLMFHEPLGTGPSLWGTNSSGTTNSKLAGGYPITANFINNAIYVSGQYKHHFDIRDAIRGCNDFSVGARVTTAWADKPPVDLNFQAILGNASLPIVKNSHKWYGVEADVMAEMYLYDHLYAALEAGVLIPGSAYDIRVDTAQLGTLVETIPVSKASPAYGGRLTLMVDF